MINFYGEGKMDLQILKEILGYASLINIGILFIWFFLIIFLKDWIYDFHSKIFNINKTEILKINYFLMGAYKLAIYLFFIVPFLVIHFIL